MDILITYVVYKWRCELYLSWH